VSLHLLGYSQSGNGTPSILAKHLIKTRYLHRNPTRKYFETTFESQASEVKKSADARLGCTKEVKYVKLFDKKAWEDGCKRHGQWRWEGT
jgi:hypothetical protein